MYLGIDLGTSGVKSLIINEAQEIVASAQAELTVHRPQDGWSEQRAEDWVAATEQTFSQLQADHAAELKAVKGIGLSGQQHGATLLDSSDTPLRPCILWNDGRSVVQAETLSTPQLQQIAGSLIFPGFTAPKLMWVADNEPEIFAEVHKVLLPKDYLRLWLTGESVSEMSDASGTAWLDVARREWSDDLLNASGMRRDQMPSLVEGSDISGYLRKSLVEQFGFADKVAVAGGAGDNAASACGMGTIADGSAFVSLGTSGVLFASNDAFRPKPESAVHTFCHAVPATWHQMGVILSATDALNWYATITGLSASELTMELEKISQGQLQEASKVTFLPYLSGERTPHNDMDIRGGFAGLGHVTDRCQLTQAVLEGVSYALRDCTASLESAGTQLGRVVAVGGGSRSSYWLKIIATVLGVPVDTTVDGDFGAGYGAARLGMLAATGESVASVCQPPEIAATIEPDQSLQASYDDAYQRYKRAYPAFSAI